MFVSKYNCSPISSNSSSVEDEAASPPISLAKLPRTAQSILVNRMRSVVWQGRTGRSTDQLREERRSSHGALEQEIAARLYFIEVIRGLNEQRVRLGIKEEERTEELLDMRDELRAEYLALLESEAESSRRLEQLRLELHSLQASLVHWNALKTEDERRHTETIQNILDLSSPEDSTPLPPLVRGCSRGAHAHAQSCCSLLSFSGQLRELSSGPAGSHLVLERLRHGTAQEKKLLWTELALPGSILSILLTDNQNLINVLLAVVSLDRERSGEVLAEIVRSWDNIKEANKTILKAMLKLI